MLLLVIGLSVASLGSWRMVVVMVVVIERIVVTGGFCRFRWVLVIGRGGSLAVPWDLVRVVDGVVWGRGHLCC